MGKTSFSGPVYGAKSLLFDFHLADSTTSTGTQTLTTIIVPPGEDWVITDFACFRGSTVSTAFVTTLTDDSTLIGDIAITSSAAGIAASTRIAAREGEYTGTVVASGSSLTLTLATGSSIASTRLSFWVYGFPRWRQDSTLGF